MSTKFKHLFFDLDGTLLDSLKDIVNALNLSFKDIGHNYRATIEEGKTFIGAGATKLIERATKKAGLPIEKMDEFTKTMMIHYEEEQLKTEAFKGEEDAIKSLKEKGYKLYILSNKPDHLLNPVIDKNYDKDDFIYRMGKRSDFLPKPNPESFNYLIDKFHLNKDEILYIGDSHYDIEFARNTGVKVMLVAFGYDNYTPELLSKADYVVKSVKELEAFFSIL